jgi:hypothetical protein
MLYPDVELELQPWLGKGTSRGNAIRAGRLLIGLHVRLARWKSSLVRTREEV